VWHSGDFLRALRCVWLTSLVLLLATFGVFSHVLVADFVQWGRRYQRLSEPHIQGLDLARLRWMFNDASYALRCKPLNWLTYALLYQIGGLKPFGYHLANLPIHCFNTVLVFGVIRWLLAAGAGHSPRCGWGAALGDQSVARRIATAPKRSNWRRALVLRRTARPRS
jgi:hypothetical protein